MKVWKKYCDERRLVIALEGDLTSNTSEEAYGELTKLVKECPDKMAILDFSGVRYISSAGLRCLIRLRENCGGKLTIIEVNDEVYKILEMTGTLPFFGAYRKMKEISLDGCEAIGSGVTADVLRLDDDTIVKLFRPGIPMEVVTRECEMARQAFMDGVPTAITYSELVRCGDRFGIRYELIRSKPFIQLIQSEPENFETYMQQYVELFRKLHTIEADPNHYPSLKELYKGFLMQSREWYTEEELGKLLYFVDQIPDRTTLLHGDFHPNNVMRSEGRLIVIDMVTISYGHPVFDLISMCSVMYNMVEFDPGMTEDLNWMNVDLLRKIWNRFVELYFGVSGQEEVIRISEKLRRIAQLRNAVVPFIMNNAPRELKQTCVDACRKCLLPCIEEVLEDIRSL